MADLDLTELLTADVFPHAAALPLGGGRRLELTYRSARPDAEARVKAAVADDLAALGVDPDVYFRALGGVPPVGEEALALESALEALDGAGMDRLKAAGRKAEGALLAHLVGSWNLTGDGQPLPVTPETCAKLPEEIRRTVVKMSREATLPAEARGFLSGSPRS